MRILIACQYYPPEPGAPAARLSELARAWRGCGHDVWVVTQVPNHPTGIVPPEYRHKVIVEEDDHGVNVVRCWVYAAANAGRARRSMNYASFGVSAVLLGHRRVPDVDIVVATSPQILCAVAGDLIARMRRVPFVLEIRDMWPQSIVAVGALRSGHPIVRGLEQVEKRLYRDAEQIVVVTDSLKRDLVARGIPSQKIDVIKNGVDLARFKAMPRETMLRARLGWHDKYIVSYAGTHGMAHALDKVLDVAERLREDDRIRFLFAGEGALRVTLERIAAEKRLDNVRFLGAVPRGEMPEVYATSDACIVCLRKAELFTSVIPSKIFEIAAMERPIVLAVDGETRAIVEASGGGLFVPPEDVDAMVSAIQMLAADPELGRSMGLGSREHVVRDFDSRRPGGAILEGPRARRRPVRAVSCGGRLDLGRLARTIRSLHPLQIAARPFNRILSAVVRGVPAARPPALRFFPGHGSA